MINDEYIHNVHTYIAEPACFEDTLSSWVQPTYIVKIVIQTSKRLKAGVSFSIFDIFVSEVKMVEGLQLLLHCWMMLHFYCFFKGCVPKRYMLLSSTSTWYKSYETCFARPFLCFLPGQGSGFGWNIKIVLSPLLMINDHYDWLQQKCQQVSVLWNSMSAE